MSKIKPSLFHFLILFDLLLFLCAAPSLTYAAPLSLSPSSITLEIGRSAVLQPSNTAGRTVTWSSSDITVATVSSAGRVCVKKAGTCLITARTSAGSAFCRVIGTRVTVTLNRDSLRLYRGRMFQLYASVTPKLGPVWKSSNTSVARVDAYGMVRAVARGTARITATAGGISRTCLVTVLSR